MVPHPNKQDEVLPTPDVPLGFTTTTHTYAHGLYREVIGESDVNGFLENTGAYDTPTKRWTILDAVKGTEDLLESVFSILSSVLHNFVKSTDPGVERHLVKTTSIPQCGEKNEDGYRNCPVLVVRASGPSFEFPWSDDPIVRAQTTDTVLGFAKIATYFVVKSDAEVGDVVGIVDEASCYARQIFRRQPNRFFVRCMVITETHARLLHFDRAGTEITPPIDIHETPVTLIRLVAGLSSTNERVIGLDDSIQWTIIDGRKDKGTITTVDSNGNPKTYPIIGEVHKPRACICGRATICWRVRDPETSEELVVKDSWRGDDHPTEHEYLELVKGIPGLVHMVSYEAGRGETKDFRCPSTAGQYVNRVASRTVTKSYGKSIEFFTSILQLLCAIRDAIAAHRRLACDGVGILHRDISHNNILLGKDGAPEGQRGILIDLDMAFRATEAAPSVPVNHDIGTRPFQAIAVLNSFRGARPQQPHDYLNELESFLYLTTYLFLVFKPDGTPLRSEEVGSTIVWKWGAENPMESSSGKRDFLRNGSVAQPITDFIEKTWGSACAVLVDGFAFWILNRMDEKKLAWYGPLNRRKEAKPFDRLHDNIDQHYSEVLKMFDDAIEQIQASPPTTSLAHQRNPSIPSTSNPSSHTDQHLTTTATKTAVTTPPAPTEAPPTVLPTPASGSTVASLRRSVRISKLCSAETKRPTGPGRALTAARLHNSIPADLAVPVSQPRRSTRIRKRSRDDELQHDAPAKARRTKKACRNTARSR